MKKISIFLFVLALCLSCNKTEKKEENNITNKEKAIEKEDVFLLDTPLNNDFKSFLTKFENLPIEKYNSLSDNFFIYLDKEFKNETK